MKSFLVSTRYNYIRVRTLASNGVQTTYYEYRKARALFSKIHGSWIFHHLTLNVFTHHKQLVQQPKGMGSCAGSNCAEFAVRPVEGLSRTILRSIEQQFKHGSDL